MRLQLRVSLRSALTRAGGGAGRRCGRCVGGSAPLLRASAARGASGPEAGNAAAVVRRVLAAKDPCAILSADRQSITLASTRDDTHKAFLELASTIHPDTVDAGVNVDEATEAFQKVSTAYEQFQVQANQRDRQLKEKSDKEAKELAQREMKEQLDKVLVLLRRQMRTKEEDVKKLAMRKAERERKERLETVSVSQRPKQELGRHGNAQGAEELRREEESTSNQRRRDLISAVLIVGSTMIGAEICVEYCVPDVTSCLGGAMWWRKAVMFAIAAISVDSWQRFLAPFTRQFDKSINPRDKFPSWRQSAALGDQLAKVLCGRWLMFSGLMLGLSVASAEVELCLCSEQGTVGSVLAGSESERPSRRL